MLALPPIIAEKLFTIGSLPITNSYVNSTLTMIGFIIFAFLINRAVTYYYSKEKAPKGLLNLFESLLEFLYGYLDQVTGNRKNSIRFLPIVGSLFFFILISNWVSLIPGVGSIGLYQMHGGHIELIPLFRPANADLNLTLAMSVFAVVVSHILGIIGVGFFRYANKFIKLGDLWHAIKSAKPVNILTAVIEFFVGILETISEITKVLSLSLRLFGNIFAGEVLLTVMASLVAFIVPLPFIALELLVGLIQAVVFSMLVLVSLTMAVAEIHGHNNTEHRKTSEEATPAH